MLKVAPKSICGLCQQVKVLQKSHFIPKSIYALASKAFSEQAGKLSVYSHDKKYNLSQQITKYFLCDECEAVFDKCGENIVVKELFQKKDEAVRFTLLDKLNSLSGQIASDKSIEWYFINDTNLIDVNAYTHLILGIIWKMSATKWNNQYLDINCNSLGSHYTEQIRQYLLTENKMFLSNIYIICLVDNKEQSFPWFSTPKSLKLQGICHLYTFTAPGVKFLVFIGKKQPSELQKLFPNNTHFCFGKRDFDNDRDIIEMVKRIMEAG